MNLRKCIITGLRGKNKARIGEEILRIDPAVYWNWSKTQFDKTPIPHDTECLYIDQNGIVTWSHVRIDEDADSKYIGWDIIKLDVVVTEKYNFEFVKVNIPEFIEIAGVRYQKV